MLHLLQIAKNESILHCISYSKSMLSVEQLTNALSKKIVQNQWPEYSCQWFHRIKTRSLCDCDFSTTQFWIRVLEKISSMVFCHKRFQTRKALKNTTDVTHSYYYQGCTSFCTCCQHLHRKRWHLNRNGRSPWFVRSYVSQIGFSTLSHTWCFP